MGSRETLIGEVVCAVLTRTSPTLRRSRLARRIRDLRELAGLTQWEAARGLDMSPSALSRKENGDVGTSVHEVKSMMDLYDIFDPELVDLARAAKEKGWWRAYGVEDKGYVDLETEASVVREFSLSYIPGLLQTEDYMRAVLNGGAAKKTLNALENDVAVRLLRQRRLTDEDHLLRLIAVVDEGAIRRPVGGSNVMREQLCHVLKMMELPSVELRVLPYVAGPHVGLDGAFTLLEFPEWVESAVLFLSHPAGAIHTEKAKEVSAARLLGEHLLGRACCQDDSRELIEQVAREM